MLGDGRVLHSRGLPTRSSAVEAALVLCDAGSDCSRCCKETGPRLLDLSDELIKEAWRTGRKRLRRHAKMAEAAARLVHGAEEAGHGEAGASSPKSYRDGADPWARL